jgi:hypothetical protein
MSDLERRVLGQVREAIGAARLEGAIVYLDAVRRHAGERVTIGDVTIELPWDAHVAFVDLEPRVNWGHDCAYLAVRLDGPEVIQAAAQMPPFLKAGATGFRLLHRGPFAPSWAVATEAN